MNNWCCPICDRGGFFIRASDIYLQDRPGGGTAVCTKCAKNRSDEIEKRNTLWYTPLNSKKDPSCKHEWVHPHHGRWYCPKCGATYNWMCGCGGSAYVCQTHYDEFIKENTESELLEKFLADKAW